MLALPQPLVPVPSKDEILPLVNKMIEGRQAILDNIVLNVSEEEASFENVQAPLAKYYNEIAGTNGMVYALRYASPDADVQSKVEEASKLWRDHFSAAQSRDDLMHLIMAAGKRIEGLDSESKILFKEKLKNLEQMRYGDVDGETRKLFLETRKEISGLCEEFNRNIRLYGDRHLLFTDEELDGLPRDDIKQYLKNEGGKRQVPLQREAYRKIMRSANNHQTRKTMMGAWASRLPENVKIFRKTILLRDENARRMGYKGEAEICLHHRMAKSVEWVQELLADLSRNLLEPGHEQFKELEAVKKRLVQQKSTAVDDSGDLTVQPWERDYLKEIVGKEQNVDHDAISEYLPFNETMQSVLKNLAKYLQIRLELVTKEDAAPYTWAEKVDLYSVWDDCEEEQNNFVGYLYLDLFDRQNKYKHFQTVEIQAGCLKEDGTRQYPSVILMGAFVPRATDGCQVMRQENLQTIYHELGHCFHTLFSRTRWTETHGYRVKTEFGEGIGTAMENFAWLQSELQSISCHYTYINDTYREAWMKRNPGRQLPPRQLPATLSRNLIQKRSAKRIDTYLNQISDSMFDLAVHYPPTHQALMDMDETKLYRELEEKYTFVPSMEPSYPQASFSHLMSGYEAGYYAYVCSNVFGEEIFQTNFATDPTSTKAWNRFRRGILQYGGSKDQSEILEEFLGRPPTPAALLRSLGISESAK